MQSLWSSDPFGLMPKTLIGWESSVDPRYTDLGEVEFLALHPTM